MSNNKLSKEEVKKPDAFLAGAGKAYLSARKHKSLILGVVVALIASGALYGGYSYYQSHLEDKASTALFQAQVEIDKLLEKSETPTDPKNPVVQAKPNYETVAPLLSKLESEIKKYSGTQSSVSASIVLSKYYEEFDKSEQALETMKSAESLKPGKLLSTLAILNYTRLLEKSGKCDLAIPKLDQVINSKEVEFLHPESLLKKGVCLEKLNRVDEARGTYRTLSEKHPDTAAGKTGRRYLNLLKGDS